MLLGVNGVVGAGIFLLPGRIAAIAGGAAWAVYVACATICFLIALCYAELGSRYGSTGGAYVYARHAFGPFIGFMVGWIVWLSAVLGWASVAVGLASTLQRIGLDLFASAGPRAAFVAALVGVLTVINLRGARAGARANNFFSVIKLLPLAIFVGRGLACAQTSPFGRVPDSSGWERVPEVMLWGLYLYSGFEEVTVPAGETQDPQRTVPRALLVVLASSTLVYLLVHLVAQSVDPFLADAREAPLAHAAGACMGAGGLLLIGIGSVASLLGTNASIAFTGPRSLYALAADGHLSPRLAEISPKAHAPVVAIVVTGALVVALPLVDLVGIERLSLDNLVQMSALATLLQYISTCSAAIVLRRKDDETAPAFRVPGGIVVPLLALSLAVSLFLVSSPHDRTLTMVGVILGLPVWWTTRSVARG